MEQQIKAHFKLLPIPMPPMLPEMVGVTGKSRYFAIYYFCRKATWLDGRELGTFSYYAVYAPFITHITLALPLSNFHLGSDDRYADHLILCDRTEQKMYVGKYADVERFLDAQHPPRPTLTPQQIEEEYKQLVKQIENFDLEQMQQMGMFEFVLGHNSNQQRALVELIKWLDSFITEELLKHYLEQANKGNWVAIISLQEFKKRIVNPFQN